MKISGITGNKKYSANLISSPAITSAGDVVSSIFNISGSNLQSSDIDLLFVVNSISAGAVVLKQVEFSDTSDFSSDVTVQDIDDIVHFTKSNRNSDVDAIAQTSLSAVGSKMIGIHPIVKKNYMRVTVTVSGSSPVLHLTVVAFVGYLEQLPNNQ